MTEITHLIYDCDGLLLDTESIHQQVNQAIAARYGKTFTQAIHLQIIGRTAPDSTRIILEQLRLPLSVEGYLEERDRLIFDLYPLAEPLPGARELTDHFHQHRIPQAIVTSSNQQRFRQKMSRHPDWLEQFVCIVAGDDPAIAEGKPAPDPFLVAAERLGVNPSRCLVFEDSPAGVISAKRAGMAVVAIPMPGMDAARLAGADMILESLLQFDPVPWHLPALPPERMPARV